MTVNTGPTAEFDCCECGRNIINFGGAVAPSLCATCLMVPGWFRDPELKRAFEPDPDWQPPPLDPLRPTG